MSNEDLDPYVDEGALRNEEAEKERLRIKDKNRNDIIYLLKMPHFRRFYWRLLSECSVFGASFNLNQKIQDFTEGKRDVGKKFLDELNLADPQAFFQLMRESISTAASIKGNKGKNV